MNPLNYLGVIIRLFSIALFIYGIKELHFLIDYNFGDEIIARPSVIFSLTSSVLPILFSIIIWYFPLMIAKKILPISTEKVEPISSLTMLSVFVITIGVYTLYFAISDGVYWIMLTHIFTRDEYGSIALEFTNENKVNIVATVIEFIMAVFLLGRARTISYMLLKFSK